jgi:glycosyltransferase involved in cell wall biosynthesis
VSWFHEAEFSGRQKSFLYDDGLSIPSSSMVSMRCPTLKELPSPPSGKHGWPWTEDPPQLSDVMPGGAPRPKISIVTPSFNQGQYIEETIRSVLLQGYPDFEYIVVDGGSADGSVEIIRRYERWLTRWVSEPDHGQSDAINKGMRLATGEIVNWINSDDCLLPGALKVVADTYSSQPGSLVVGAGVDFDEASRKAVVVFPRRTSVQNIIRFWEGWFDWLQPSIFFSRQKFLEVGGLAENLHFSMDIDLYCRLMQFAPVAYTLTPISRFRRHGAAKTQSQYHTTMLEHIKVVSKYKQLLNRQEARAYNAHTISFLLRRMKRLSLDRRYLHLMQYLLYTLSIGRFETLKIFFELVLNKLKRTTGGITSL